MPPQTRRQDVPVALARATGPRRGRRTALTWSETPPRGAKFHIKPLGAVAPRLCEKRGSFVQAANRVGQAASAGDLRRSRVKLGPPVDRAPWGRSRTRGHVRRA